MTEWTNKQMFEGTTEDWRKTTFEWTNEWRNKQMNEKRMKKHTTKGDWRTNSPSPSVATNSFIAFAKIQKELL